MRSNTHGKIQPYGREWDCDRSAPDYDPQRDPWNPSSPVYGQSPRTSFLDEIADQPVWWGIVAWVTVTASLVLLYYLNLISHDTLGFGFIAKYVFLFAVAAVACTWSAVQWRRRTPLAERVLAYRGWVKRLPGNLAWFVAFMAICAGLDWLDKWAGVPLLFTGGACLSVIVAVIWRTRQNHLV